jgi:hypothetical protein
MAVDRAGRLGIGKVSQRLPDNWAVDIWAVDNWAADNWAVNVYFLNFILVYVEAGHSDCVNKLNLVIPRMDNPSAFVFFNE